MSMPTPPERTVEEYVRSTGGTEAFMKDAQYRYQAEMLKHVLAVVNDALVENGITGDVIEDVAHRIVWGAGPRAADATERKRYSEEIYNLRSQVTIPSGISVPFGEGVTLHNSTGLRDPDGH